TVSCWGALSRQVSLDALFVGAAPGEAARPTPTAITGIEGAVEIGASDQNICARKRDATVTCWTWELAGRAPAGQPRFLDPSGAERVVRLAIGRTHACVIHDDGGVSCWGGNSTMTPGEPE